MGVCPSPRPKPVFSQRSIYVPDPSRVRSVDWGWLPAVVVFGGTDAERRNHKLQSCAEHARASSTHQRAVDELEFRCTVECTRALFFAQNFQGAGGRFNTGIPSLSIRA